MPNASGFNPASSLSKIAAYRPTPLSISEPLPPLAINNLNQVVGSVAQHASLWDNGALTDLGTLGGQNSNATEINDACQVVGWSEIATGDMHAFLRQNGVMPDLGVTIYASDESLQVNNLGVVVGNRLAGAGRLGFVWENGAVLDLSSLVPTNSGWTNLSASDVNDRGQITGSGMFKGVALAFVYNDVDGDGKFSTGPGQIVSLGTLRGGVGTSATAMNDSGQVTGFASISSSEAHAFRWTPTNPNGATGKLTDLGALSNPWVTFPVAGGLDINDAGVVVGRSTGDGNPWSPWRGFVAEGTTVKDLNSQVPSDFGWLLSDANGINNSGWIVGSGGRNGGYLLIPGTVAVPLVSINNVTITEGKAGTVAAVFTVTLSKASSQTVTVEYGTAGGSALAGSDYIAVSGTLTFAPGQTTQTITVPVLGDTVPELTESVGVNLSNSTNALFDSSRGLLTIYDDDSHLTISDVTIMEGNGGTTLAVFTVTLSAPSTETVTVHFATRDNSAKAGSDYVAASGMLTFAPGKTTMTITVLVLGDTALEADEYFYVDLTDAVNAALYDPWGLGTIRNDEKSGGKR